MPPIVAADFTAEGELGADAGIIAGEEFDFLHVASVFESERAAAGAGEFAGFDVHGDPLEAGAGKDFQSATGAERHLLKGAVDVSAVDAPDTGEGTFRAIKARPFLRRIFGRGDVEDIVFQAEAEPKFLPHLLRFGGVELNDGESGGVRVDRVGAAERVFESVGAKTGDAPVVRSDDEHLPDVAVELPGAGDVLRRYAGGRRGDGVDGGKEESEEGEAGEE